MHLLDATSFFVFDVESAGLYGEALSVGGGIYRVGRKPKFEFNVSCGLACSDGCAEDIKWVKANVPDCDRIDMSRVGMMDVFWERLTYAIRMEIPIVCDCPYPVETSFLKVCVDTKADPRKGEAPYPLYDLVSILAMAGWDPMKTYSRQEDELPVHDPLADSRQSARLLMEALMMQTNRM